MKELKPKELRVFEYIKGKISENGYAPSVREICAALNIKSTSTSQMYIDRLIDKGYLEREDGKSRTLKLSKDVEDVDAVHNYKVPLLGQVAAGLPILAEQNIEGYIDFVPAEKRIQSELFALRIKGESMIEAGIMDGDYVVVCRTSYVENGDIAVVIIDDEATVKTFYRENGHFRLQPENKTMKPIITNELFILGKVIACVRYYG